MQSFASAAAATSAAVADVAATVQSQTVGDDNVEDQGVDRPVSEDGVHFRCIWGEVLAPPAPEVLLYEAFFYQKNVNQLIILYLFSIRFLMKLFSTNNMDIINSLTVNNILVSNYQAFVGLNVFSRFEKEVC